MKKFILIITTLCFSLISFSQENNEDQNNNTISHQITIPEINFDGYEFNISVPKIDLENPISTYTLPEINVNTSEFNFHIPEKCIEIPNFEYEDITIKIPNVKIDEQNFSIQIPDIQIPEIAMADIKALEDVSTRINKKTNIFSKSASAKKQISQNYKVSDNCKLSIDNSFGKIEIIEWDKNEIYFDITVQGEAKTESKAYELIDCIDVVFNQSSNGKQTMVEAKTKFCSKNKNQDDSNYTVDYVVKVPSSVFMDLKTKYGNIYLGDVKNNIKIDISFGNIYINKLNGDNNNINSSFGDIEINEITKYLNLQAKHCGKCTFNNVNKLAADIQFSKLIINNKAEDLNLKIQHSSTSFNEITNTNINSQFTDIKINKLNNYLNCSNISHGGLRVDDVAQNFSEINVNASFGTVRLGLNQNHSFAADLRTSFGSIKLDGIDKTTGDYYEKTKDYNDTAIRTVFGKNGKTASKVTVRNQHGNIVLGK
ncbi:MAG: DUF4097 domain-containing protein [Bacteroidales bacterium]|jgi:hypothetical protein|nr:DUF4097 domain-containing protein [Bacteroidales bacterium]